MDSKHSLCENLILLLLLLLLSVGWFHVYNPVTMRAVQYLDSE